MNKLLAILTDPIFWLNQFIVPELNDEQIPLFEKLIELFKSNEYKVVISERYHTIHFYLKCDIPEILQPYTAHNTEDDHLNISVPEHVKLLGYDCVVSLFDTLPGSEFYQYGSVPNGWNGLQMDIDIIDNQ